MKFYTIGVYNSTASSFFGKLMKNRIDIFCDIRQRRGVRGSKYSYVNSTRLQKELAKLNIGYRYIQKLAPSSEVRQLQRQAGKTNRETGSQRQQLGKAFRSAYIAKVLNRFDFDSFIEELESIDAKRVVLFCVEENAEACHRSLVADRLSKMGYTVTHI